MKILNIRGVEFDHDQLRRDLAYRALQESWTEAYRVQWERRARDLEAARPRRGDFNGRATPRDLVASWDRLTAAALACRLRGAAIDLSTMDLDDTLEDLAAPLVWLEQELRHAIDAGEREQIDRLSRLVEQADMHPCRAEAA